MILSRVFRRHLDVILQVLDDSEGILFALVDAAGLVIACSSSFARAAGNIGLMSQMRFEDVVCGPDGGILDVIPAEPPTLPLPHLCRFQGKPELYKMGAFRVREGLFFIGERLGNSEDGAFRGLSSMTGELVNLSREMALKNKELADAYARIEEISRTDALTGLGNRRHFLERLDEALASASRHGQPVSLVMADLDYFKRVNDTYGHNVGDDVLREFANILKSGCRREDLPARYGGEEFIILLPQSDELAAMRFAERVRHEVETANLLPDGKVVTVSLGVCELGAESISQYEFMRRTDVALYAAKEGGRNCIVAYRGSGDEIKPVA